MWVAEHVHSLLMQLMKIFLLPVPAPGVCGAQQMPGKHGRLLRLLMSTKVFPVWLRIHEQATPMNGIMVQVRLTEHLPVLRVPITWAMADAVSPARQSVELTILSILSCLSSMSKAASFACVLPSSVSGDSDWPANALPAHLRPRILLAMLKVANKAAEKYIRHNWLWPLRERFGYRKPGRRIPPAA